MKAFGAIIVLIIIIGGWYWLADRTPERTGNANEIQHTIISPDGVGLRYATTTWGLATNPEQVIGDYTVVPCDPVFLYCMYYIGNEYEGTNFDSAGLRVTPRPDLTDKNACLTTLPTGYTGLTPQVRDVDGETYATSVFAPLGALGAGHLAAGALYRLSFDATCYEFETRIAESQFANYEEGTIEEFMAEERSVLYGNVVDILNTAVLVDDEVPVIFPALDTPVE